MLHLRFGQHAESFIANEYKRATRLKTYAHPKTIFHPEHGFMFGHIDRFVCESNEPVVKSGQIKASRILECKTASVFNRTEWGQEGSGQTPSAYLMQCAWYLAITRCEVADVAVLLGNNDFRIYQVKRDLELEDLLLMHAQKFWSDHVLSMSPPNPITTQDAAVLFPKNRPGSEVEANAQIYQTLEQFREKLSHASALNTECERLKTEILTYMGHSERLSFGGKTLATWKCTNPSQRIDTKALAADVGQRKILNANVAVGLGVDGSASNDAAHMLNEARQAMLLARVSKGMQSFGCDTGPSEMTPRQALHLATRGGAQVLGRARDVGQITVGYCADIAMFRTDTLAMAGGAVHDPVGALMLCASSNADYTIVNGKVVVDQGHLSTVDLQPLIEKHNNYAKQLALGAF